MIKELASKIYQALAPAADRYNADPTTSVVDMRDANSVCFVLEEGAGGTGTATITILECDSAGANTNAIPFHYRLNRGTLTACAATGYALVAGANKQVEFFVDARAVSASLGYVALKITETVDSAVAAGVIAIVDPRASL